MPSAILFKIHEQLSTARTKTPGRTRGRELPDRPSRCRQERRFRRRGPCSQGISETGVREGVRIMLGPEAELENTFSKFKLPFCLSPPRIPTRPSLQSGEKRKRPTIPPRIMGAGLFQGQMRKDKPSLSSSSSPASVTPTPDRVERSVQTRE